MRATITTTFGPVTVECATVEELQAVIARFEADAPAKQASAKPKKSRKQARTDRMTLTEAKAAGLVPWGMTKREAREAGVWRGDVTGYVREQIRSAK